MLRLIYTDPKGAENKREKLDISSYVTKATWSGDSDQAARKLEFQIAYNTPTKDRAFTALDLLLGGYITAYYEDDSQPMVKIFEGRIFYRKRSSNSFTFEFSCYDDLIYLAKSNIRAMIVGTVPAAITQVCNEIGIPVGTIPDGMNAEVNFICEDKTCTEAIRMILDYQEAADRGAGKETKYLPICLNGKVCIIRKGELIEGYTASAEENVLDAQHSESIEDMVNRVKAVDDNGAVKQVYTIREDVNNFGMIQKIYKMQPPKDKETVDNVKGAKALLKRQKDESSLKGIGNVQCITGYAIEVEEEQLKGKFYIRSDSHTFENDRHMMDLTLEYMPDTEEEYKVEVSGYAQAEFDSSSGKG